mgnify:CR=1 FL=1
MIKFREVNDEYLEYDRLKDTSEMIFQFSGEEINKAIVKEFIEQDLVLFEYSKTVGKNISRLTIRKDSLIGRYLLTCNDEKKVLNISRYVDYDKVVNAFNISVFSKDLKMSESIYPLFINRTEGTFEELSGNFDSSTIEYILTNSSFKNYLNNLDNIEKEPVTYVVYENGKCFEKEFNTNKNSSIKTL